MYHGAGRVNPLLTAFLTIADLALGVSMANKTTVKEYYALILATTTKYCYVDAGGLKYYERYYLT